MTQLTLAELKGQIYSQLTDDLPPEIPEWTLRQWQDAANHAVEIAETLNDEWAMCAGFLEKVAKERDALKEIAEREARMVDALKKSLVRARMHIKIMSEYWEEFDNQDTKLLDEVAEMRKS